MDGSLHIKRQAPPVRPAVRAGLSRRQTLKWMGVISAALAVPAIQGCDSALISWAKRAGDWPELDLKPIGGAGYGKDPDLINPPGQPWPLTMTPAQRELTTVICDILIPREGDKPAASEVGVVDVIDEWISAPYESFQADRAEILPALAWLDQTAMARFNMNFVQATPAQQLAIIEDIAYESAESDLRYVYMAKVFDGIRTLTVTAYFTSPEGTVDLGYQGGVAIAGDYPGPTDAAMLHLGSVLAELDLSKFAYNG